MKRLLLFFGILSTTTTAQAGVLNSLRPVTHSRHFVCSAIRDFTHQSNERLDNKVSSRIDIFGGGFVRLLSAMLGHGPIYLYNYGDTRDEIYHDTTPMFQDGEIGGAPLWEATDRTFNPVTNIYEEKYQRKGTTLVKLQFRNCHEVDIAK